MDDFKIIYKILKAIYAAMDYDDFDYQTISPEALGVSKNRRDALLMMLVKSGYIEGIEVVRMPAVGDYTRHTGKPQLTLAGLEYLEDNSLMKKAAKLAAGIADVIS